MPRLLVSVRSVAEAEAALAGGAALIDVKEPSRGSLGRATDATIGAILESIERRRPVSAALGELRELTAPYPGAGLAYAKWGLAGCGAGSDWREVLAQAWTRLWRLAPQCRPVAVAYADWREALSPSPDQVCAHACASRQAALLLDTWGKNGKTLLDWLSLSQIERLCRMCHAAGIEVALAGSLGPRQIRQLLPLAPDWFAVRGAACRAGRRGNAIDARRVRALARLVSGRVSATLPES